MNVAARVRQSYEKRPYPAYQDGRLLWQLPPWPWIEAMWQPARPPRRILVAGCGTGREALVFAKRFPETEIVGADFSPRSIAIARRRQHSLGKSRLRFVVVDLAGRRFAQIVGTDFDFVSCHGVLTYIPRLRAALQNLTEVLREEGALYLGVNGARHYSENWRKALPAFAINVRDFNVTPDLRKRLRLLDALSQHAAGLIARQDQQYLASDLLTPIIFNRPLAHWVSPARRGGLHFCGSYAAHRNLRPAFNADAYDIFLPRSRAQVHEIVELVSPAQFHALLFRRTAERNPPWEKRVQLLEWRPCRTSLYSSRWPRAQKNLQSFQRLALESKSTNTAVSLFMPRWVFRILEAADGTQTIRAILGDYATKISTRALSRHLYLLYLLVVVNFLPPEE